MLTPSSSKSHSLKLYFEYVLFNIPHLYIFYKLQFTKTTILLLSNLFLYYTSFHLRFSSLFYSSQLVDMFAYELPVHFNGSSKGSKILRTSNSIVVYNFHNLLSHNRFFVFAFNNDLNDLNFQLNSISELYPNSN